VTTSHELLAGVRLGDVLAPKHRSNASRASFNRPGFRRVRWRCLPLPRVWAARRPRERCRPSEERRRATRVARWRRTHSDPSAKVQMATAPAVLQPAASAIPRAPPDKEMLESVSVEALPKAPPPEAAPVATAPPAPMTRKNLAASDPAPGTPARAPAAPVATRPVEAVQADMVKDGRWVSSAAPVASVAPSAASARPADPCDPPFYFDDRGNRLFKKQCL
jgi:hypothetical protein